MQISIHIKLYLSVSLISVNWKIFGVIFKIYNNININHVSMYVYIVIYEYV